jgi:hypothetical protein
MTTSRLFRGRKVVVKTNCAKIPHVADHGINTGYHTNSILCKILLLPVQIPICKVNNKPSTNGTKNGNLVDLNIHKEEGE